MRILFVRLSSFGDVVFAMPAAKALKTAFPDARLAWAVEGPLAPLLEGAGYVDEILVANTRAWRKAPLGRKTREEIRSLLRKGRELAPDLIVDAQGLFKSALVTAAIPAKRKVGFGPRTATEKINCLFTNEHVDVDRAARPHAVDQMLALAEHVTGRAGFERTPDVRHLVEKEDQEVDSWLEQYGKRPFALLQAFSSKGNKEWAPNDLIAFSEWLSKNRIQPVLRWGPGEESRAAELLSLSKESSSSSSSPSSSSPSSSSPSSSSPSSSSSSPSSSSPSSSSPSSSSPSSSSFPSSSSPTSSSSSSALAPPPLPLLLAPPTTPASSARLAARAALFVGADTGPTHLAAAAGTPTLALFGPTPPERFAPVGPRAAFLRESRADYNRSRPDEPRWPLPEILDAIRRLGV